MNTFDETLPSNLLDFSLTKPALVREALEGLTHPRKNLPAKLLYDERGSEIFEKICLVPSYYPTRTEKKILRENADEITRCLGEDVLLIEPGSGAAEKVRYLLPKLRGQKRYIPVEISREILLRTTRELHEEYPELEVYPVCADFTQKLSLPMNLSRKDGRKIVFFPGSTIGNLYPDDARKFLREIRTLVGEDGGLLIGVDRKKDPEILRLAYNDPEGVTSAFNLNLLERLNREADATFAPENFVHEAIYNEELGRIEMHLVSRLPQLVRVDQTMVKFREGETIHTENSYKYAVEEFQRLGESAGFRLSRHWSDSDELFTVYYFESVKGKS